MARHLPKGSDIGWWWWIFGLLIGIPALVLAALGISALRLDDVDQRQRARDGQDQIVRLAAAALSTAFDRESTDARGGPADGGGTVRFEVGADQVISFPVYRTYAATLGAPPPAEAALKVSGEELLVAERAQEAAAQGNISGARTLYLQLESVAELRAWAALQLDLLGSPTIPSLELASSSARSPSGIPVAIVASSGADVGSERNARGFTPFLRETLRNLRDGRWWLSLEQRRAYDAMLRESLNTRGVATSEDPRLLTMESLLGVVRTAFDANRQSPPRAEIAGPPAGEILLVWSRPPTSSSSSALWTGIAIPRPRIEALTAAVLQPLTQGQGFAVAFRDQRRAAWPAPLGDTSRAVPLESLAGWSIAFSSEAESVPVRRKLLRYSMVFLPIAMLAFGLAITAWIIRRELALRRMQSAFVAGVTHEFKSPITSIRLLIERIAGGRGADAAAVERYARAMGAEADRLDALVNRLLNVQKLQAGQKQYTFEAAAIDHLVHDVVERVRPHAESRRITLALDAPRDLAPLALDADAVADAVRNLLDNAIKYCDPGGAVDVSIAASNGHVVVTVADDGVGVDPREAGRIFEPFYRSVRGDRTNVQGSGLGLAQVKAIADAHGGAVTVSANGARGSRFALALPTRRPDTSEVP
jgi:signal transduction histidine kinase